MRPIVLASLAAVLLFLLFSFAIPAAALDAPKVVVKYSLRGQDGGGFLYNITETPFGLGDTRGWINSELPQFDDPVTSNDGAERIVPLCSDRPTDPDCSPLMDVVNDDGPLEITLEYTADESGNIIDGPVEVVGWEIVYKFVVHFPTEDETPESPTLTLTTTDAVNTFRRGTTGVLNGSKIDWGGKAVKVDSDTITTCEGLTEAGDGICASAAPQSGWPRLDVGVRERVLPIFSLSTVAEFADRFATDNDTPSPPAIDELDDLETANDDQTVVIATYYGAQVDRRFVPEPAGAALALTALGGLAALRRVRRA